MVEFDVPFFIGAINMAALCSDSGKIGTTYRVLLRISDAKRHTIRLDRVSKKIAETARRMIESLEAAKAAGHSPNREAAEWVGRVSDEIHSRLERAGLVPPRQKAASAARTLGQHRDQGQRLQEEYFGKDRTLESITEGDADGYKRWLLDKFAVASASVDLRRAGSS